MIIGERHAIGLELIELLHDLQVKLVPILGLILHSCQKKSEFGLDVFKAIASSCCFSNAEPCGLRVVGC